MAESDQSPSCDSLFASEESCIENPFLIIDSSISQDVFNIVYSEASEWCERMSAWVSEEPGSYVPRINCISEWCERWWEQPRERSRHGRLDVPPGPKSLRVFQQSVARLRVKNDTTRMINDPRNDNRL